MSPPFAVKDLLSFPGSCPFRVDPDRVPFIPLEAPKSMSSFSPLSLMTDRWLSLPFPIEDRYFLPVVNRLLLAFPRSNIWPLSRLQRQVPLFGTAGPTELFSCPLSLAIYRTVPPPFSGPLGDKGVIFIVYL